MIKYSLMQSLVRIVGTAFTPKFIRYAIVGVVSLGTDYFTFL